MSKHKHLSGPEEFRDRGYLQEVNRRFFHPLGLALAVDIEEHPADEDGWFKVQVWDCRDGREGFLFTDLTDEEAARKADTVRNEAAAKATERLRVMGGTDDPIETPFVIQAVGSEFDPT